MYALSLALAACVLALLLCVQISVVRVAGTLGGTLQDELETGAGLVSVLRSLAPASTGSALLIALVAWAHPLSEGAFRSDLGWVLKRGAVVTPPAYVAASVLGGLVAAALGPALFDIPARAFAPTSGAVRELAWGLIAAGIDSALVTFLGFRFLGLLRSMRLSLAGKLVVACTAIFPLRAMLGLILESVLPG